MGEEQKRVEARRKTKTKAKAKVAAK